MCSHWLLRVKSQLGVISIDRSLPMSSSREPSLCVGLSEMVGSEVSSATNGWSVRIVAGKKRSPAKPCAIASAPGSRAATAATARPRQLQRYMIVLRNQTQGMPDRLGSGGVRLCRRCGVERGSARPIDERGLKGSNLGRCQRQTCRFEPDRERQDGTRGRDETGKCTDRAAHRALRRLVSAVARIGVVRAFGLAGQQHQQAPAGVVHAISSGGLPAALD